MISGSVDPYPLCDVAPRLAAKLEIAILSVLVHNRAEIESTLPTWYLSLKLAFPEVKDSFQIKSFLTRLWKHGVIALKSPWIGDFTIDSADSDLDFLELGQFTVALTSAGVGRWDSLRRYPTETRIERLASREPCSERVSLSNRVSEAQLAVAKAISNLDEAKARKIQNLELLHAAVGYRRSLGRDAVRAFEEHVKEHGCVVSGVATRAVGR